MAATRPRSPSEPAAKAPVYSHVEWPSETSPYVTVAFRSPGFSATDKDFAAIQTISDLYFGGTSDIYKKLVEQEQVVDQFFNYAPGNADPYLFTIFARVKDPAQAVYVRDEIMKTFAQARNEMVSEQRLADAKSNARYGFARGLDNTEEIASSLAAYVRYDRRYETLNELFRTFSSLTPADMQAAAQKYFTDNNLIVTTLSQQPLPDAIDELPKLASFAPSTDAGSNLEFIRQPSKLPIVNTKLLFTVGSAYDPKGKEGLSALAASMITEAGSKEMQISEINKALYPIAASFGNQVDKEMTTLTAITHRDNWRKFLDIAMPMLTDPGFREEDFNRLKDLQLNALKQDLRTNNEEELGKEYLQGIIFRGTPYAHPVLGTVAGIESITLDDVKEFVKNAYTQGNVTIGISGDVPAGMEQRIRRELAKLPATASVKTAGKIKGSMPKGIEVDIIEKDTRATAISFGHPIEVTRSHPDYAALYLARTWLGEHRSSMSQLYQRIRESARHELR